MEFQTRSEADGIEMYPTLKDALEAAEINKSIWKISFPVESGERVRLIRVLESDMWILEQMDVQKLIVEHG